MDPITLATVTSSITVLAMECAKGAASEAGKGVWKQIQSLLGWQTEPSAKDLAGAIASTLSKSDTAVVQIVELLKTLPPTESTASTIIGSITAEKVVSVTKMDVAGNFQM